MKRRLTRTTLALSMSALAVVCASSAHAVSMQECGDMYQAAKAEGSLKGLSWNEFRKTYCAAEAAAPAAAAAAPTAAAPAAASAAKAAPAPVASGPAVFPTAIAPKYAKESQGKARMHTCLDQYNANKPTEANGGLRWIQKGGGYYSECNKRLQP